MCVCVSVYEREKDKEIVCGCRWERQRQNAGVCVLKREAESVCVGGWCGVSGHRTLGWCTGPWVLLVHRVVIENMKSPVLE